MVPSPSDTPTATTAPHATTENLSSNSSSSKPALDLAAVVLLAGSVRQTELARIAQRPLLDLPLRSGHTLAQHWADCVKQLRTDNGLSELPFLVTANSISGRPGSFEEGTPTVVRMDTNEPRGSGGALRDALLHFDPNSYVLIAPGHALPQGKLLHLLAALAQTDASADIVIHADAGKAPTGYLLLRCGVLASVASNGFADLKEQVLPQLASKFNVRVLHGGHPTPLPIRSLDGYIHALRFASTDKATPTSTPVEEWSPTFSISEQGAEVSPSATLHDSVVLRGGKVGAEAVVVRCLVGPGGNVAKGEVVFDSLLGTEDV